MSQDAVAVVTLIGSLMLFMILSGNIAENLARFMRFCFEYIRDADRLMEGGLRDIVYEGLQVVLRTAFPIAIVTVVCAVAATFAQTRMLVSFELIKPKFSKLNPLSGLKRLFSLKSIITTLKNLLKIIVLMVIVYNTLKGMLWESSKYLYTDLRVAGAHIFDNGVTMVMRIIIAFVALAAVDFFYQRWDYERNLRMSKQEIKEEYKQTEGDPQIKGKIKEMQRRRAMSRMMQQVPQSDVVIRNPTHFAVALRYKPGMDPAPIVLAKGQDELALRIVRVAEEHNIAVIENVQLARALYANTELDQEIPPELYDPVAKVMVYIFRLNKQDKLIK